MKRSNYKKIWEEICFILSESVKLDILETVFEQKVIMCLEKLGWSQYEQEIIENPKIGFPTKTFHGPQIGVFDSHSKAQFIVQVYNPNEKIDFTLINKKLVQYMKLMDTNLSILFGCEIYIFYRDKSDINDSKLIMIKLPYLKSSKDGINFVKIFYKDHFLFDNFDSLLRELIDQNERNNKYRTLIDCLLSSKTKEKIFLFLRNEFSEFDIEILNKALKNLNIDIQYRLKGEFSGPNNESFKIQNSVNRTSDDKSWKISNDKLSIRDTVYKLVNKFNSGITIKDIKQITGLNDRQVRNALFRLTNTKKVTIVERGKYVTNTNKSNPKRSLLNLKKQKNLTDFEIGELQKTVYKVIQRRRNGISVKAIKELTGFEERQVSNSLYKLSKKGLIETSGRGKYIVSN